MVLGGEFGVDRVLGIGFVVVCLRVFCVYDLDLVLK